MRLTSFLGCFHLGRNVTYSSSTTSKTSTASLVSVKFWLYTCAPEDIAIGRLLMAVFWGVGVSRWGGKDWDGTEKAAYLAYHLCDNISSPIWKAPSKSFPLSWKLLNHPAKTRGIDRRSLRKRAQDRWRELPSRRRCFLLEPGIGGVFTRPIFWLVTDNFSQGSMYAHTHTQLHN